MDSQEIQPPPNPQIAIDRFVAACQADERVVAAFLGGSYARGTADAYSDLDLYLITRDEAYDDFVAGREAFMRLLGEPVFLEDFGIPNIVFFILPDGIEGELGFGRESRFNHIHSFITAMGRGQLWWAYGQLEALRRYCVNLARLRQDFADADVGEEGYFKVEQAIPVEQLSSLQATFCPQEEGAMLQSVLVIVRFYQELAPLLAQAHGITYPVDLERVMVDRLERLCNSSSHGSARLRLS